jgi:hypothetical protein
MNKKIHEPYFFYLAVTIFLSEIGKAIGVNKELCNFILYLSFGVYGLNLLLDWVISLRERK